MTSESINESNTTSLLSICRRGDYDFLAKVIAAGGTLNNIRDKNGRTALHYCVETESSCKSQTGRRNSNNEVMEGGRLKCAEALLKCYPDLMNVFDIDGMAPIHHGVAHDNLPLMKLLLDYGSSIDLPLSFPSSAQSNDQIITGRTLVHLAVMYGKPDILQSLLDNSLGQTATINVKDSQNAAPLHYAVQLQGNKGMEIMKILCNIGKCDLNITDAHNRTPLSWAATIGNYQSVVSLLKLKADPTIGDESGLTPLHCAASRGHLETVEALIELNQHDERVIDQSDHDGCTPLFYSTTMGHLNITKKLLDAGADATRKDKKNRSLCHCATRPLNQKVISEQIRLLTIHGADPWSANDDGETPLHDACQMGNAEYVMELALLPEFKEHVNDVNKSNVSIISTTVKALLDPMMHKYHDSLMQILKLLTNRGANVNAIVDEKEGEKQTILDLLMIKDQHNEAAIELLRMKGGKTYEELQAVDSTNDEQEQSKDETEVKESTETTPSFDHDLCIKIEDAGNENTTLPSMISSETIVQKIDEPLSTEDTIDVNASPVKSIVVDTTNIQTADDKTETKIEETTAPDLEPDSTVLFQKKNNILDEAFDMFDDDKTEVSIASDRSEDSRKHGNVYLDTDKEDPLKVDDAEMAVEEKVMPVEEVEEEKILESSIEVLSEPNEACEMKEELLEVESCQKEESEPTERLKQDPIVIPSIISLPDTEEDNKSESKEKSSSRKSSQSEPVYDDEFLTISSDSEENPSVIRKQSNEVINISPEPEPTVISSRKSSIKVSPKVSLRTPSATPLKMTETSICKKKPNIQENKIVKSAKVRPKTAKPSVRNKPQELAPFSKVPTLSDTISDLTGRKKMPKPTLSPYLTPLIPPKFSVRSHSASSRGPTVIELVQTAPRRKKPPSNKKSLYGLALQPGMSHAKPPLLRSHLPPRGEDKEREQILALHQAAISRNIARKVHLSVSDFQFIRIAAQVANQYNHMLMEQRAHSMQTPAPTPRGFSSSPLKKQVNGVPRSMRGFQDMLESQDTMMQGVKRRSKSQSNSTAEQSKESTRIKIPTKHSGETSSNSKQQPSRGKLKSPPPSAINRSKGKRMRNGKI